MKSKLIEAQVREAFTDNPKLATAAGRLGCSVNVAYNARNRFGIGGPREGRERTVRAAFKQSGTLEEIGERLGITKQRAHQLRLQYGIAKRKGVTAITRSKVAKVWGEWLDVLSPADVCQLMELHTRYDQSIMQKVVKTRQPLRIRARQQVIHRMYRDGWGIAEIARTVGTHWNTVHYHLTKSTDEGTMQ